MDLTNASLDHLKTLHNVALAEARSETKKAQEYRAAIEAREPSYHGRSQGQIANAVAALYTARTFANTPHDLPEAQNPYRLT